MTLRELLDHIKSRNLFNACVMYLHTINDDWNGKDFETLLKSYNNVALELSDLPGDDELAGHEIRLKDVTSEVQNIKESYVDVHLFDGESPWSVDFIDWNQLIDLPVVDETGSRSLTTRLAVILYEITFWGRTRHSVLHEAETLKFDSDNIVPFSLDELTELE